MNVRATRDGAATVLVFALVVCCGCTRRDLEPGTLNIPITEPILAIDPFNYTQLDLVNNSVYDSLIWYDHESFQTYPQLAKSWRRIDDTTLEFELRDDVKFHDGTPFDADDVVATISYLIDPDTIFPFKRPTIDRALSRSDRRQRATRRRSPESFVSAAHLQRRDPRYARGQGRLWPQNACRHGPIQSRSDGSQQRDRSRAQ